MEQYCTKVTLQHPRNNGKLKISTKTLTKFGDLVVKITIFTSTYKILVLICIYLPYK